jgi:rfaE bifunctional protein nucleotidyltransferase chain/domain/rfaE bifunctional protein kinase chain/domain
VTPVGTPRRPLVVVGDALLDRDLDGRVQRLSPEGPVPVVDDAVQRARPGGAALAAALAARDGREVTLVCALAPDLAGRELAAVLDEAGVQVCPSPLDGGTPEKVRIRSAGRTLLRLDRGSGRPARHGPVDGAQLEAIGRAGALLVADYGYGFCDLPAIRDALAEAARERPVVWDPHPHGSAPVAGAALVTPNRQEASRLLPDLDRPGLDAARRQAHALATRWDARAVCVTLGADGALLASDDGDWHHVPAPSIHHGDPCGAGDRFAAEAAGALADGATATDAVAAAVRAASAFVQAGGAAAVRLGEREPGDPRTVAGADPAEAVAAAIRARGGTVVATGGCFDLLHAGHVSVLEAARALGDGLIVCLNSDASVRRLKGPDRPVVGQDDRAALLAALRSVDAVAVFDEDTPEAIIERLRPDIWAKGGDYRADDLPETALVRSWGGETVILPYIAGRSTTQLIREVLGRGV